MTPLSPVRRGSQFRFPLDLPFSASSSSAFRPPTSPSGTSGSHAISPPFSREHSVEPSITVSESVDDGGAGDEYVSARRQMAVERSFAPEDLTRLRGQLNALPKIVTQFGDDESDAGDLRNLPDSPSSTSVSLYSANTPATGSQTPRHGSNVLPTREIRAKSTSMTSPSSNSITSGHTAAQQPPTLFLFGAITDSVVSSSSRLSPNLPLVPAGTALVLMTGGLSPRSGTVTPTSVSSAGGLKLVLSTSVAMESNVPEDPVAEAASNESPDEKQVSSPNPAAGHELKVSQDIKPQPTVTRISLQRVPKILSVVRRMIRILQPVTNTQHSSNNSRYPCSYQRM